MTDLIFTGDLFEFNGNMVQAAFGYQYRDVNIEIFGDSLESAGEANEESVSGPIMGSQDTWAVFREIIAPVTDTLELQFAMRREEYGGSTVCVSTGLNNNITVSVQGSPDLEPQESENFNLGIVFQFENGLNASLDYFDFDYQDLIAQSEGAQAIVDNDCLDDGVPNDPRIVRDAGGQLRQVNTEFVNIGSVITRGLDFNLAWNTDLGPGNLFLNAAMTCVTNSRSATAW